MKNRIARIVKEIFRALSFFLYEIAFSLLLETIIFLVIFIMTREFEEALFELNQFLIRNNTYVYTLTCIVSITLFLFIQKVNIKENIRKKCVLRIALEFVVGIFASFLVNVLLQENGEGSKITVFEFIIYSISSTIIVPVAEEIVFRSFLFSSLRKENGIIISCLISAIVFAVCHFNIEQIIYTFPMGILFAYSYEKDGLFGSVTMHVGFNITALLMSVL